MSSREKIDSVYDFTDKGLVELKAWLEPWFLDRGGSAVEWEDVGLGCSATLSALILATPDLVAFWKLNEPGGDIAYDSKNGWDLDSGGFGPPTFVQPAGPPGETSALFGTGLAEINSTFPALTGDLTLEVWAKSNTSSDIWLITQGFPPSAGTNGVALCTYGSGGPQLRVFIGAPGGPHVVVSDTTIDVGAWYHLAVTRDSHIWTLYVNGVAQPGSYDDAGTSYTGTAGINVGYGGSSGYYTDAYLSYAAVYSRALTVAELLEHYTMATS